MSNPIQTLEINEWVLKLRLPDEDKNAPVILLLHGWTGDENSMWVFTNHLSEKALLVAPRALFPSSHENKQGFSWVEDVSIKYPQIEAFSTCLTSLIELMTGLEEKFSVDFSGFDVVGFSQGAALAAALLLSFPEKVRRLGMLSGFLPEAVSPSASDLAGKRIFIGHGSRDEIVPRSKAEDAYVFFQAAGADVDFCLTEVGHKLGSECFRAFNRFFGIK